MHKTIGSAVPEIPSLLSLAVIVAALGVAVVISIRRPLAPPDRASDPATSDEHLPRRG